MTEVAAWVPPDPVECSRCRRTAGVAIVYGMPYSSSWAEAAENGQIALGGCVIVEDQPQFRCRACGHEWHVDEQS